MRFRKFKFSSIQKYTLLELYIMIKYCLFLKQIFNIFFFSQAYKVIF